MQTYHHAWLKNHPERDEAWLQSMLSAGFDVHHVDGNHANDDPANLVLIEHVDHMRIHGMKRLRHSPGHMQKISLLSAAGRRLKLSAARRAAIARKAGKTRWAKEDEKLSSLPRRTQAEIKRRRKKRRIIQGRYRKRRAAKKLMYAPTHSTVSATSANEDRAAEQRRGEAGPL